MMKERQRCYRQSEMVPCFYRFVKGTIYIYKCVNQWRGALYPCGPAGLTGKQVAVVLPWRDAVHQHV